MKTNYFYKRNFKRFIITYNITYYKNKEFFFIYIYKYFFCINMSRL